MAVGILLGVILIPVLFTLGMIAYIAIRKKRANSKWFAEVLVVGSAFLLSFVIKLIAYNEVCNTSNSFLNGFINSLQAMYLGIGGLTFEGLQDVGTLSATLQCVYYCTSIFAGLMFLGVITAKASYETYSYAQMLSVVEHSRDIYVFTALTEETLQLAKSVKEEYATTKNRRKAKIIFAGPSLKPFDGHNDLCREVMANSFLYWSYSKKCGKGKTKSISKVLHINNRNYGDYDKNFVVFAFDSEGHVPKEEDNMDVVFSDINTRIEQNRDDKLRIEYYILTKREINYQAYEEKVKQLEDVYKFKYHNDKEKNDKFKNYFVINVWNEAYAVGKCAVKKLMNEGLRNELARSDDGLFVWSLGFGGAAEAITNELFVQSPGIDGKGNSREYIVDVYDNRLSGSNPSDVFGLFRFTHPNYEFLKANSSKEFYNAAKILSSTKNDGMPHPIYRLNNVDCMSIAFLREIDKVTGPAEIEITTSPATTPVTPPATTPVTQKEEGWQEPQKSNDLPAKKTESDDIIPNVIVIATGDDYQNIRISNAILQDVVNEKAQKLAFKKEEEEKAKEAALQEEENKKAQEAALQEEKKEKTQDTEDKAKAAPKNKQYIILNIYDSHNNALLPSFGGKWNDDHTVLNIDDDVTVVIVGNCEETYRLSVFVSETREAANYNLTYNLAANNVNNDTVTTVNKILRNYKIEDKTEEKNGNKKGENVEAKLEFYNIIMLFRLEFKAIYQTNGLAPLDTPKLSADIVEEIKKIVKGDVRNLLADFVSIPNRNLIDFNQLDLWTKESNRSVVNASKLYFEMYKNLPKDEKNPQFRSILTENDFAYKASCIEHDRWCRHHMSDGWIYCKERKKIRKQHDCLNSFLTINQEKLIYDFLNVMWAIADNNE